MNDVGDRRSEQVAFAGVHGELGPDLSDDASVRGADR
jgi:hypothetical protein